MRWVYLVIAAALATGAILLPEHDNLEAGELPALSSPPIAICPLAETGAGSTAVNVLSSIDGPIRVSGFASGSETGATETAIGPSGANSVDAASVDVVALAGGLVELPVENTAVAVTVDGDASFATAECAVEPEEFSVLAGGSTADESSFEVLLLNPYAGEAIVDLTVVSENGIETDGSFSGVVVPALSVRTVDLSEIIPERITLDVAIDAKRGSVIAYGRHSTGLNLGLARAVAPTTDSWIVTPSGEDSKELVITSFSTSPIDYQVDLYGPDGLVLSFSEGTLTDRGSIAIDLNEVSDDAIGVRVIATDPIVTTVRVSSPERLALTAGVENPATSWLLAGAGGPIGGFGDVVVLNAGVDPVSIRVHTINTTTLVRDLDLEPDSPLEIPMAAATGYRVDASGPVVVFWTADDGTDVSLVSGFPLTDG